MSVDLDTIEDVPYPPAQCLAWKESKAEPCNTCSHGRKLHSVDGKFVYKL
jgi:hypothetical protein